MKYRRRIGVLCLVIMLSGMAINMTMNMTAANRNYIILLATTSVENSGFLDYILPHFESATGLSVRAVIAGSGASIRSAMQGNGDVLLTHSPTDEAAFIASGWGVLRHPFMYNEFVIIGPRADNAQVATADSVEQAFRRIAETRSRFVSRADNSGTDKREQAIWESLGITTDGHARDWYLQSGSGMSMTFNIATSLRAYVFGDNSTWLRFGHKGDHKILFADSRYLKNQYALIAVNPKRHPHVKARQAQIFIRWMLSETGQNLIAQYRINGKAPFIPNASP